MYIRLVCEVNPIPVKAAMSLMGYCSAEMRLPLTEAVQSDFLQRIMALGAAAEDRRSRSSCPVLSSLTPREQEIAALAARRLSNREIAEKLHLSEGSVKQYISQIYSKLAIEGDTRLKRQRLAELVNT